MTRVGRQLAVDGALLALAVLSAIVVLVARTPANADPAANGVLLPSLLDDPPSSLTLKRDGRTVHVVNRAKPSDVPHWVVESPWQRTADAAMIDAAIEGLRELQWVRKLDGPPSATDARAHGLDQPTFTWQVGIDGAKWSIAFGATAPAPRGGTYVDVTGPDTRAHHAYVATVDSAKLSLRPEQLLEPRLLPYVASDFREISVETAGAKSEFRFDPARSRWYESNGAHRRLARESIEKLLFDLANLKGEHFFTPSESLDKSWKQRDALVGVRLDKRPAVLQIALFGPCEEQPNLSLVRVSGDEDVTACARVGDLQSRLEEDPSNWVDRHLFSLRTDEIEQVTLHVDGHSLELQRRESAFVTVGKDPRSIDVDTGNQALESLVSIRGVLSQPPAEAGSIADSNYVRLRSAVVTGTEGYEERILVAPPSSNGDRWVKRLSDSAWLHVDASAATALAPGDNWLRSKVLIDAEPSSVQMIELVSRGRSFRWTADGKGLMRSDSQAGSPLDADAIEKLRAKLARLRVKEWLERQDPMVQGHGAARVTFEINDGDGAPRRYTLEFALDGRRRLLATVAGSGDHFEAEPELSELLGPALR